MNEMVKEFQETLDSMTKEELDALWDELKVYNNIGPTVSEYFKYLKRIGVYPKKTKINK